MKIDLKKLSKKVTALMLAGAMCISTFSVTALADGVEETAKETVKEAVKETFIEKMMKLEKAKETAIEAIEEAGMKSRVLDKSKILEEAKDAIGKAMTIEEVESAKNMCIEALEEKKAPKGSSELKEIRKIKEEAKKKIDKVVAEDTSLIVIETANDVKETIEKAGTIEEIENVKNIGIEIIKAKAKELAKAKEEAKETIDTMVANDTLPAVIEEASNAKVAIEKAGTVEEVASVKDSYIRVIKEERSKELRIAKTAAKKVIDEVAQYDVTSNDVCNAGKEAVQNLEKAKEDAETAIENAITIDEVESAKIAGIKAIEEAKEKADKARKNPKSNVLPQPNAPSVPKLWGIENLESC